VDHNHNVVAILSMVIPIVAIFMGVSIGMLSLYLQFRRKRDMFQLYHTERMAAIEKGIELPPLPPQFFQDTHRTELAPVRHRRAGLILLFLGIALSVALWGTGVPAYLWGLVPAAIGLALLVASVLETRDLEKLPRAQGRPPADS
jgi:peptidoglycan/LPS O-acetylase OafA/YrhL